jgi:hypothetical protein
MTFIAPPGRSKSVPPKSPSIMSHDYSRHNLNNFKEELSIIDWSEVYNKRNVDVAYEEFWNRYKNCHDACFPLKRVRFNKNIHTKNPFMTFGLLTSRNTKNRLHKLAVSEPIEENVQRYKRFKAVYFRVLRGAKKLYFTSKLNENLKNPKKTWETLNEILGKSKQKESLSKINIHDVPESDPSKIANHFNSFFTSIGKKISDDVQSVDIQPEDYINYGRNIPELILGNTTPEHILKIISKFKPKPSCDIHGVSTKMVKFIGREIATPVVHFQFKP